MRSLLPSLMLFCLPWLLTSGAAMASPFSIFEALHATIDCTKLGPTLATCEEESSGNQGGGTSSDEGQAPAKGERISSESIYSPMAMSRDFDYLWASGERYNITENIGAIEDFLTVTESCERLDSTTFLDQDVNGDELPDLIFSLTCFYGMELPDREWRHENSEQLFVFWCREDTGYSDCTEAVTGYEIVNASSHYPGRQEAGAPIFIDLNDDGRRDIIFNFSNDNGAPYPTGFEEEVFELYRNFYGADIFDQISDYWRSPEGYLDAASFNDKSIQTYLISTPSGYELHEFDWPGVVLEAGLAVHESETGVHAVFSGNRNVQGVWFTFDRGLNEFVYVANNSRSHPDKHEGTVPVDTTLPYADEAAVANAYDPFVASTGEKWISVGGKEFAYVLSKSNYSSTARYGSSCWKKVMNGRVDEAVDCRHGQSYIVTRDESGEISDFLEFSPFDFFTARRYSPVGDFGNGTIEAFNNDEGRTPEAARGPGLGLCVDDCVAFRVEDRWLYNQGALRGWNWIGRLSQLEDSEDAPWYLLVAHLGWGNQAVPNAGFQAEILRNCYWNYVELSYSDLLEKTDPRCRNGQRRITTMKFLIDFDKAELQFEGFLFNYPHSYASPTIQHAQIEDLNSDGWMDFTISIDTTILSYVSDADGDLDFVNHNPGYPALDWLVNNEPIPMHPCSGCQEFRDMNGDGLHEYYRLVPGELPLGMGRIGEDNAATYRPGDLYLEIFYSDYQPLHELPKVTPEEMHKLLRRCAKTTNSDAQCYGPQWL
jgi:hypothetical protein